MSHFDMHHVSVSPSSKQSPHSFTSRISVILHEIENSTPNTYLQFRFGKTIGRIYVSKKSEQQVFLNCGNHTSVLQIEQYRMPKNELLGVALVDMEKPFKSQLKNLEILLQPCDVRLRVSIVTESDLMEEDECSDHMSSRASIGEAETCEFIRQRYQVNKKIGRGNFGDVYLVYDHKMKSTVALKQISFEKQQLLNQVYGEVRKFIENLIDRLYRLKSQNMEMWLLMKIFMWNMEIRNHS